MKLADFGRARMLQCGQPYVAPHNEAQPVKWMPPEGLKEGDQTFDLKSDIWSFGVFIVELLLYGDAPFQGTNNQRFKELVLTGGKPLDPSDKKSLPGAPERLRDVIRRCWAFEGKDRPSASELFIEFSMFKSVVSGLKFAPTRASTLLLGPPQVSSIGSKDGSGSSLTLLRARQHPKIMPLPSRSEPLPPPARGAGLLKRNKTTAVKGSLFTVTAGEFTKGEFKSSPCLVVDVVPLKKRRKLLRSNTLMQLDSLFCATVRGSPNLLGMFAHHELPDGAGVSCMVLEAATLGTLHSYLVRAKQNGLPLTQDVQRAFGSEIASGLAFLESQNWIHGDLGTRNVLLSPNRELIGGKPIAKIMDSGFAIRLPGRAKPSSTSSSVCASCRDNKSGSSCSGCTFIEIAPQPGNDTPPTALKWAAPELVLSPHRFSFKSDAFAFGVLLQELANNGKTPYPGAPPGADYGWWAQRMTAARADAAKFSRGEHTLSQIIPNSSHPFASVIRKCCWELRPCNRPTFLNMQDELEKMSLYEEIDDSMVYSAVDPTVEPPPALPPPRGTGRDAALLRGKRAPPPVPGEGIEVRSEETRLTAEQDLDDEEFYAEHCKAEEAEREEITLWLQTGQGASNHKLKFLEKYRADCVLLQQVAFYQYIQNMDPSKIHEILKVRRALICMLFLP